MSTHTPTEINLNRKTRTMTVSFAGGESFEMSCEYLRVHSPSAEVQGYDTGIYSRDALYAPGKNQAENWRNYLAKLMGVMKSFKRTGCDGILTCLCGVVGGVIFPLQSIWNDANTVILAYTAIGSESTSVNTMDYMRFPVIQTPGMGLPYLVLIR